MTRMGCATSWCGTEDAGKINRIMERFSLATVDSAAIKTEIEKSRAEKAEPMKDTPAEKNVNAPRRRSYEAASQQSDRTS